MVPTNTIHCFGMVKPAQVKSDTASLNAPLAGGDILIASHDTHQDYFIIRNLIILLEFWTWQLPFVVLIRMHGQDKLDPCFSTQLFAMSKQH